MSNKAIAIIFILGALLYTFIIGLGDTLMPLLAAFGLAYLLFPIVQYFESKGISRHQAVIAVFSSFVILFLALFILIIPGLAKDFQYFITELPQTISSALMKIENLLAQYGVNAELSREDILIFLQENSKKISSGLLSGLGTGLNAVLGILNLFLIPLFFFYLIDDYEKITSTIQSLIPNKFKPKANAIFNLSNEVLNGYIRGQLMVAICLSALYAAGLSLIGLKFGLLIGILTGLISIIPYAGFTLGLLVSIAVSLAHFNGFGEILAIAAVFGVIQLLEGFLITPKLVGDKLGLSAFATMLALIVGGNLLGVIGMLAAIPMAAILKYILSDLIKEYRTIGEQNL